MTDAAVADLRQLATPRRPRRRLVLEVATYGTGMALAQVVTILTAPFFARRLGPSSYGVLELLNVTISLIVTAFAMGVDVAALRAFIADPDARRRSTTMSTGLILVGGSCAVMAAAAAFASAPLARTFLGGADRRSALVAAAAAAPLLVAATFTREVLRAQRRPLMFLTCAVTGSGLGGLLGVVAVGVLHAGVAGVFAGFAAGWFVATMVGVATSRGVLRPRFSTAEARALLAFGLPLLPAALAGWSLMLVDRFFVEHMAGLRELGFYAIANKVTNVALLLTYAFGTAWTPHILQLRRDAPETEAAARAAGHTVILAMVSVVALGIALFAHDAVLVFGGAAYLPGARAVPLLALSLVLFAGAPVSQSAMVATGRTRRMALQAAAAAAVNVLACLVLIPPFGTVGAAAAAVVGLGCLAGALYRGAEREQGAPMARRRDALLVVTVAPLLALGWWTSAPALVGLIVKLPVLGAYSLLATVVVARATASGR